MIFIEFRHITIYMILFRWYCLFFFSDFSLIMFVCVFVYDDS